MGRKNTVVKLERRHAGTQRNGVFGILPNVSKCGRALVAFAAMSVASSAFGGMNQWTSVGPDGGNVGSVVITPGTPSRTYASAYPGSVYLLDESTQTWTAQPDLGDAIVPHPTHPNLLFIVSLNRVFSSNDGGATRVNITPPGVYAAFLKISQDGTTLYTADFLSRIVYRSTDSGATWTAGSNAPPEYASMHLDPTNANRLITLPRLFDPSGSAAITNDGGNTWTTLRLPPITSDVYGAAFNNSSAAPQLWFAGSYGLWHTSNYGASWTESALTGTIMAVAVNPANPSHLLAQKDWSVYRSDDGGASWTLTNGTNGLRRASAFVFDPRVPNRVFMAGSPGVWVSDDGGTNWSTLHRGINATWPSRFSSSMDRTYFAVHEQIYYLEAGASSTVAIDATALRTALPPTPYGIPGMDQLITVYAQPLNVAGAPRRVFAGGLGGGLARSTDGGQTWSRVTDPVVLNERVNAMDSGSDPNVLLALTFSGILRSTDGGDTWSTTSGVTNPNTSVLKFGHANIAYAGGAGSLYRSVDGGLTWSQMAAAGIDTSRLWSLINHGDTAYAQAASGVFKTTNGGASWTQLPVPGTRIFWLGSDASGLFVARTEGLARSTDAGNTWTQIASFPQGITVTSLHVDPTTRGRVLAATSSNGVHEYTMASDLAVAPTGKPTTPPGNGARADFQFTVTNRGPHTATSVSLKLNVAGRVFYDNGTCAPTAGAWHEVTCPLSELPSGASRVVRIESDYSQSGPIEITASVEANEAELVPADNVATHSASYEPPAPAAPPTAQAAVSENSSGGGGAVSWSMLVALASVVATRRRFARQTKPAL